MGHFKSMKVQKIILSSKLYIYDTSQLFPGLVWKYSIIKNNANPSNMRE